MKIQLKKTSENPNHLDDRRREGGDRRREGGDRRREGGDRRREGGDRRREGGDRRREGGDRRREGGDRRREGGDRRREGGDRRREGGDRRREGGDRRREGGDRRREGGDRRREENFRLQDEKREIQNMKDQIQIKRERSLEEDNQSYFWIKSEGEKKLATENLVPGNQVYKEKLIIKKGIEYRLWDAFRSKLAAAIMNELEYFPFENKSKVLYLGASTGTTVSHISDIVGPSGIVFGVEHASRVARDFLDRVASYRSNIIPILQDARKPKEYFSVFGKVDIVYVDIAQPDQTQIALDNCEMYLKKEGYFFLVIKTRSIDVTKSPRRVIEEETDKLKTNFDVLQSIDLHPYDKDHAMIIAKYKN